MEEARGERIVGANAGFVALVPHWTVWPFEVMILPRRHVTRLENMTATEKLEVASFLDKGAMAV